MAAWQEIDRFVASWGIEQAPPTAGTTTGSPCGQGHVTGSNHYPQSCGGPAGSTGQARDHPSALWTPQGIKRSNCVAIFRLLEPFAQGPNYVISELFHDPIGHAYKRGQRIPPIGGHGGHNHSALRVGSNLPTGPVPVTPPRPIPAPPRRTPMYVAHSHPTYHAVYATDWVSKWWLPTARTVDVALFLSENPVNPQGVKTPVPIEIEFLNEVPLIGRVPEGYEGVRA